MTTNSPSPTRRQVLAPTAAAGALGVRLSGILGDAQAAARSNEIHPFRTNAAEEALVDLRQRLAATRWPDKETVADQSQGAQLAKLQELVRYWATDYDWRKGEAKLNAFPQFKTAIDGVDIHFIHLRSRHPNALPLIITHGWPGSVFEQIKPLPALADPVRFGGRADDAFHVVVPSLPGCGFSSRPTEAGWGVERIGRAWDVLMKRLGYARYVAQGGDWGAGVVEAMGRQAPVGLLGIHTNLPAVFPPDAAEAIATGGSPPAGLSEKERAEFDAMHSFIKNGGWGYLTMMSARPQAVGYGLTDSPAGLAGWMLVYGGFGKWTYGKDPKQAPTPDEVLDNFSLHWLTNTATSGARLYWENRDQNLISAAAQKTGEIKLPVAITTFPDDDLFRAPETWARRAFPNGAGAVHVRASCRVQIASQLDLTTAILHLHHKEAKAMSVIKTLAAASAAIVFITGAFAQSAREIRGATPYAAIENEPAPKLIVDPPIPEALAQGIFWAQYRVENVRILPLSGRVLSRHLHVSRICTSPSTTCPGGGRTRATTTPWTSPGSRPARTR